MRRTALPLIVTLLALVGCSTNPSTGRKQLILVSAAQTDAMGAAAKPELIKEYGGEVESPELRGYVTEIGQRLAREVEPEYANIAWDFTVLDSDVINAFALPGGRVFMSRGLLVKLSDEAEIAGVLGHEIGHVTALHVDERISQSLSVELGIGLLGTVSDSDLVVAGGQLFGQGYLLRFNRSQESEADDQGLKYMAKAGYDPAGMLGVLRVLMEASEGNESPEFLSTHPHPETRIDHVQSLLAGPYRFTRDNPEYQLFADRFDRRARPYLK